MKNPDPILEKESKSEANFCISQMDSDVQAILMVMLCMKSALIKSMPLCSNRKCIRKILDLFRLRPIGLSLVIFGLSMNRIPVRTPSLNLLAI